MSVPHPRPTFSFCFFSSRVDLLPPSSCPSALFRKPSIEEAKISPLRSAGVWMSLFLQMRIRAAPIFRDTFVQALTSRGRGAPLSSPFFREHLLYPPQAERNPQVPPCSTLKNFPKCSFHFSPPPPARDALIPPPLKANPSPSRRPRPARFPLRSD